MWDGVGLNEHVSSAESKSGKVAKKSGEPVDGADFEVLCNRDGLLGDRSAEDSGDDDVLVSSGHPFGGRCGSLKLVHSALPLRNVLGRTFPRAQFTCSTPVFAAPEKRLQPPLLHPSRQLVVAPLPA